MRVGGDRVGPVDARRPGGRCAGDSAANRPNAPSTCSQAPYRWARSARSASGSKSPALGSPAVAISTAGAPSSSASRRRIAVEVDPADVVAGEHLDRVLAVAEQLQRLAGAGMHVAAGEHRHPGQPGQPVRGHVHAVPLAPPVGGQGEPGEVGERGARGQRAAPARAAARPAARSQSSATVSTASASRDEARTNAFWSSSDTVQSAASAAGVEPPMTKWKKRGPAEAVAVAVPTRSRRLDRGPGARRPARAAGRPARPAAARRRGRRPAARAARRGTGRPRRTPGAARRRPRACSCSGSPISDPTPATHGRSPSRRNVAMKDPSRRACRVSTERHGWPRTVP